MNAAPLTPSAEPAPALFDADFMRKLETLHLLARKLFRGQNQNDRTTLRRGMGEDLTIHLLVYTSRSMQEGQLPKIDFARRVAAALGYIGLNSLDRVGVVSFADGTGPPQAAAARATGNRRHAAPFRGPRLRGRHQPEPRAAHLRAPEP